MRFNESLLRNTDYGEQIFRNAIDEGKELLVTIFGIRFDDDVILITDNSSLYRYEISFKFRGRILTGMIIFEKDSENILNTVLKIKERILRNIPITVDTSDYQKTVNEIMDVLEGKYSVDFTPLDPSKQDPNIQKVYFNSDKNYFEAMLTSEKLESKVIAKYQFDLNKKEQILEIIELNEQTIFLD